MKYGRVFHIRGSCSTGHVANQHCLCSLTTAASVVEVQPCFDELFHLLEWTILDSYNVHLTWCMVYGTVFVAATTLQPDLWGRKDPADTAKHAAILHRPGPARYLRQIEWTLEWHVYSDFSINHLLKSLKRAEHHGCQSESISCRGGKISPFSICPQTLRHGGSAHRPAAWP